MVCSSLGSQTHTHKHTHTHITIDGSKYARPLTHVLNVNNVSLADEGEYTCLLEDTSCVSDTLTGYLLGEIGRPGALSCGVDSLTTITLFK